LETVKNRDGISNGRCHERNGDMQMQNKSRLTDANLARDREQAVTRQQTKIQSKIYNKMADEQDGRRLPPLLRESPVEDLSGGVGALASSAAGPAARRDEAADAIRRELHLFALMVVQSTPITGGLGIDPQRRIGGLRDPDGLGGERFGEDGDRSGCGTIFWGLDGGLAGLAGVNEATELERGLVRRRIWGLYVGLDVALRLACIRDWGGQRRSIIEGEY